MTSNISEKLQRTPFGKSLQFFLGGGCKSSDFSPALQEIIRRSGENNLLRTVAHFTDNLIEKYSQESSLHQRIITSKLAVKAGCKIIAPRSLKSGIYVNGLIHGSLSVENNAFVIRPAPQNRIHSNRVQWDKESIRFTIAHEIVHTMFYKPDKTRPSGLGTDKDEEFLCDYGACRLLLPDSLLISEANTNDILTPSTIISISRNCWVPYLALCEKLFDPFSKLISDKLAAIILWGIKKGSQKISHENVIPRWSKSQEYYIPGGGRCHTSQNGVVYNTFKNPEGFPLETDIEEVKIGSMTGKMLVQACAFGNISKSTRFVLSTFRKTESCH